MNLMAAFSPEHGSHPEGGAFSVKDFIMHHVQDEVIYSIEVFNINLSITKHVIMMWCAAAILITVLLITARRKTLVPKGFQTFLEWVILYLKQTVFDTYLGHDSLKYAPYLLTAFFFILTCNLLGLVPMGSTATGNISVTAGLAVVTFFFVQFYGIRKSGFRGYIKSFVPPNLPGFVVPIIFGIEVLGMFTKHIALAVRLFANMFSGHLVIFTIMGLIFLFKNFFVSPLPVVAIVFLSLLEILIAFIQSYIFTLLSAVFIGMTVNPHH